MPPIIGIDLGTTNRLVAVASWRGGGVGAALAPRVIPDAQGRALLPSVVRYPESRDEGGSPIVGHEARDQAIANPRTTIASVKRLMGRSLADARADLPYLSYEVVEVDDGRSKAARLRLPDGRLLWPQEVSAEILRTLREQASAALGVPITRAVVTVPAYFDEAQRQATRDAGRLAGLDVVRVVAEPTAAALAYGIGLRSGGIGLPIGDSTEQIIAVYDLGGGTFDASILRVVPGGSGLQTGAPTADIFQVLSTSGDTHLGGDDIDHALVELFTREIGERFFGGGGGSAPVLPPETRSGLRDLAERAKVRLSEHESAAVRIEIEAPTGSHTYERTVTRTELEAVAAPLLDRTIEACTRALRDAKRDMAGEPVSCVVLVGGATRMPLARRRVGELFGLEPYIALDPDQVVALGAAVQGAILSGAGVGRGGTGVPPVSAQAGALLLDVLPLSLGIETAGGAFAKLIMRNSTVPARATERFSTSVDGQTSIKLHVLQGEREMAADCRSLGVFHLSGLPPMPAGIPKLRVEFAVDVNGVLSVSAVEERSGKRAGLQVVPTHGLSREEVERIEAESFEHAREDMDRHRVVDLLANAKLDLHWITKQMDKHGGLLSGDELDRLRAATALLRDHIDKAQADWRAVDANAFHRAKEDLDKSSVRLHEVSIAASLREQSP
ncbi:MAG: Hsp70 family protein [Phycisphaerales bacterium]|nr:Hsp70 family protein [Phycisphaerales bacterium]